MREKANPFGRCALMVQDRKISEHSTVLEAMVAADRLPINCRVLILPLGEERKGTPMFKLTYLASDGYRKQKSFKTLTGAQKYAQKMIGKTPEFGGTYAVSADGIGTIRNVEGCNLRDLFPKVTG